MPATDLRYSNCSESDQTPASYCHPTDRPTERLTRPTCKAPRTRLDGKNPEHSLTVPASTVRSTSTTFPDKPTSDESASPHDPSSSDEPTSSHEPTSSTRATSKAQSGGKRRRSLGAAIAGRIAGKSGMASRSRMTGKSWMAGRRPRSEPGPDLSAEHEANPDLAYL